jgi:hypothetical protein
VKAINTGSQPPQSFALWLNEKNPVSNQQLPVHDG